MCSRILHAVVKCNRSSCFCAMASVLLVLYLCALLPTCLATVSPYLLFSTWHTVSRMNLDGSNYSVLVDPGSVGPQAVDYHWRVNQMFWSNYVNDTINQANLDGSNPTVTIADVNRPSGLAVDWINDRLYFSFGDPGSNLVNPNHLAVYDITAGGDYVEITTSDGPYHELVVDPVGEQLYWTTGSRLIRYELSGESVEVLFSGACYSRGLALNVMLYFTDMCTSDELESIRSLNLTTLQESTIIESSNVDADHGVTVYGDTVYWTGFTRVYSTPITGGGNQTELHYMSNWWGRGITVVHPDLQPSNVTHFESEPPSSNSPEENSIGAGLVIGLVLALVIVTISVIAVVSGVICHKMVCKGKTQTQNDSPRYQGTLNNAHNEGGDPFYSLLRSTGGVTQPTPLTSVREEQASPGPMMSGAGSPYPNPRASSIQWCLKSSHIHSTDFSIART